MRVQILHFGQDYFTALPRARVDEVLGSGEVQGQVGDTTTAADAVLLGTMEVGVGSTVHREWVAAAGAYVKQLKTFRGLSGLYHNPQAVTLSECRPYHVDEED